MPSVSPEEALKGAYTLIDCRSPAEFAEAHVPGAVNLPLLSDEQRVRVGSAYREGGPQAARLLAVEVLSSQLPRYLRELSLLRSAGSQLAVMCSRGGDRSRNLVLLLAMIGIHAVQVEGGYRAYRRWFLQRLELWRPAVPSFTLYGPTGSGKTAVLRALADLAPGLSPRPAVIDLEGLALHRGSMLGGLNQQGSRSQKQFDSCLWEALEAADGDYLVVEGEGAKVGHIFLPESVVRLVREGVPVLVEAPVDMRAARILEEYSPETWSTEDRAAFASGLERMTSRLGAHRVRSLRTAFEDGRFGDVVSGLLREYYDPLYRRSCMEGRDFSLVLETGADPYADARGLSSRLARILQEKSRFNV